MKDIKLENRNGVYAISFHKEKGDKTYFLPLPNFSGLQIAEKHYEELVRLANLGVKVEREKQLG